MEFELSDFSTAMIQPLGMPKTEKVVIDGEEMKAYVFKDRTLMSPGTWNKWYYAPDELVKAYNNTDWSNPKVLDLYADHEDRSTRSWIGQLRNPRMDDDSLKGDLMLVDKEYVKKLMFGAKFGVSPKLLGQGRDGAVTGASYANFSIVTDPACKTTFLNEEEKEIENAVWTTKYVNDLPDSSFAYVEPGEKDDEGKTVPRSKRHLPYKDADGKVDPAHLRNALARLKQTDIPDPAKASALSKLRSAAKGADVEVATELSDDTLKTEEKTMDKEEKKETKVEEKEAPKAEEAEDKTSEVMAKLSELSTDIKAIKEKQEAAEDEDAEDAKEDDTEDKEEPKEKEEAKPLEEPSGEPVRQSVKDSEVAPPTKGDSFVNADIGMCRYLEKLDKGSETFDLSFKESADYPWMTFELASTVTAASDTRGSAITSGYRLQPIEWAKSIVDGGKNALYLTNLLRQATIPDGVRDYIMPYRKKYEDTWESSSEEYAAGSEISMTVLNEQEGIQFTPTRYNYKVGLTNKTLRSNAIDLVRYAREEMAYKWANDVDAAVGTALNGATESADTAPGKIIIYGGDATTDATIEDGDVIDTDMVAKAKRLLKSKYNYYWDAGTFTQDTTLKNPWEPSAAEPVVLAIAPEQEEQFLTDSQFVNASEYGDNEVVLNGEIGKYIGVKVVVSNNTPSDATLGGSGNIAGHKCLMVKSQRCGGIAWAQKPQIKAYDWPEADQKRITLSFEYDVEPIHGDAIVELVVADA